MIDAVELHPDGLHGGEREEGEEQTGYTGYASDGC